MVSAWSEMLKAPAVLLKVIELMFHPELFASGESRVLPAKVRLARPPVLAGATPPIQLVPSVHRLPVALPPFQVCAEAVKFQMNPSEDETANANVARARARISHLRPDEM